jgi:membrane-associated phospholipid phosphatase
MRPAARLIVLGGALLGLLLVVYVLALGTEHGRHIDAGAVFFASQGGPRVHNAAFDVIRSIDIGTLALAGTAMLGLAVLRRRVGTALVGAAALLGATATAEILKRLLGSVDPLDGEQTRLIRHSFPSGHSTIAMSLGLALLFLAPRGLRIWVGLAGSLYATAMGVSLIVLRSHYPSDVLGGFLVASVWFVAGLAVLRALARNHRAVAQASPQGRGAAGSGAALLLVFTTGVGLALALGTHRGLRADVSFHRQLVATGLGIAGAAIVLFAITLAALELLGPDAGERPLRRATNSS